jgi:hypothetical protein
MNWPPKLPSVDASQKEDMPAAIPLTANLIDRTLPLSGQLLLPG